MHTLATVMAGSSAAGCNMVVDLVEGWGGRQESTILVYGKQVPCVQAALANSCMAHARDFCNNDDRLAYKTSVCAVPTALAVAERKGKVSGKELITAVCLGVDLGIRIGLATRPKPAHGHAPMLGPFASAAVAGKMSGLDQERMVFALGLALCHCKTGGTGTESPSLTKRLGPGLAAAGGVFSALLAEKGYPTQSNVLEGPRGYFQTFYREEGDLKDLVAGLGMRFEITNVGPKPYPCCRFTHAAIDATLALVKEHNIVPEAVSTVRVYLSQQDYEVVGVGTALDVKRQPRTVVDAQFSVPWTVATAIVKRRVFVDDFTEDAITNPQILEVASKVLPVLDPELDQVGRVVKPAIVEIRTRGAQTYSRKVDFPRGSLENPIKPDEIKENFAACARYATKVLDVSRVAEAANIIAALETVDDVSSIARLLSA